ncbi:MAG: 30S ribosomal protein S17 [Candidatus Aenigmatarchaeota archaeon]|nr:MAG: 30S ribosomal protein S17 [Candidatus Aenigmarchaeota archaeon]
MVKEKSGKKKTETVKLREKPAEKPSVEKIERKEKKKRVKTIGLEINPPEKTCEDIRCPWHGKISIRDRAFKGVVKSVKAHATAVVEWGYHHYFPKYERYERRKSRVMAHNPPCIHAREGDEVMIAGCRSLSKTKHFVVVGILKK